MVAERGSDPRTSGLWAQHASTAVAEREGTVLWGTGVRDSVFI